MGFRGGRINHVDYLGSTLYIRYYGSTYLLAVCECNHNLWHMSVLFLSTASYANVKASAISIPCCLLLLLLFLLMRIKRLKANTMNSEYFRWPYSFWVDKAIKTSLDSLQYKHKHTSNKQQFHSVGQHTKLDCRIDTQHIINYFDLLKVFARKIWSENGKMQRHICGIIGRWCYLFYWVSSGGGLLWWQWQVFE